MLPLTSKYKCGCGAAVVVAKLIAVMQEAENGRALCEGTVLCSQDRIPIGRVEDTFGPVMCPLYTLRWAGQGQMPSSLVVGCPVFTTQALAEYLLPEQLYTNVSLFPRCHAVIPAL